jgi:hypothetical protein
MRVIAASLRSIAVAGYAGATTFASSPLRRASGTKLSQRIIEDSQAGRLQD